MAQSSRLSIYRIVPSAPERREILGHFGRAGGDLVAFSGAMLKAHVSLLKEDTSLSPLLFGAWVRKSAMAVGAAPLKIVPDNLFEEAVGQGLEASSEDSPFALSKKFPGTRRAIAKCLSELGNAGVEAPFVGELASRCTPTLKSKLAALGAIGLRAESICRDLGYAPLVDAIELCLPLQSKADAKLGRALLLVGDEWSISAERFCRWFLDRGGSLTILVESHAAESNDLFRAGWRVQEAFPEAEHRFIPSESQFLKSLFTTRQTPAFESSQPELCITSAPDPLAECEETLRQVYSALQQGSLPSEIAIFARDLDQYGPALEAASRRLGVSLCMSRRVPLLSNGWIRFLFHTLGALAQADVRALLKTISSSYVDLSYESREEIGSLIRNCYREGSDAWGLLGSQATFEVIKKLLSWRSHAISDKFTLSEWVGQITQLRSDLSIDHDPGGATLERDARSHFVLARALNARVSVQNLAGVVRVGLSEFVRICAEVAKGLDVSLPASSGVSVHSNPEALEGYRTLFVLGMLEGKFPRRRSEDPILNDMDRAELAKLGIHLETSFDRSRLERGSFYRLAAGAREMLTLSYPETDEDRDNIPAFYLEEAAISAGDKAIRRRVERSELTPPLSGCVIEADRLLRRALDATFRKEPAEVAFVTDRPMESLGRHPGWEPSVKDLRDVTRCPFQYFGKRLLNLRAAQMSRRWAGLRQIPIRAKLASQPNPESAREAMLVALEEEVTRIIPDCTDWEIAGFRAGGIRQINEWIEREFATRKVWPLGAVRHDVPLAEVAPGVGFEKLGYGGIAPAVTDSSNYHVVHLYEGGFPDIEDNGFRDDADLIYFGLYMLASYRPETRSMAIDIESLRDGRRLIVIPRLGKLAAQHDQRLTVKDISPSDQPLEAVKLFSKQVKAAADRAKAQLRTLSVTPTPGPHCTWCDLGELCRRSAKFSEEIDPFDRGEAYDDD